jgi:uncharacterized protein YjbI with pentapeptide repeats
MIHTPARSHLHAYLCGAFLTAAVVVLGAAAVHAQNSDHVKQLLETRNCVGCDLQNAQLINANLNRADLTGANLSGAFLYRSSLNNANLKDAQFDGANLKGVSLRGARDANLAGAITDEHTTCPNGRSGPCQ